MPRRALPYALIAPSIAFLLVLFVWPLAETILISLREGGAFTDKHYAKMFSDLNFKSSLKNTLLLVVLIVPIQIAVALGMAMLLTRLERGRTGFLYVWTIPLGISDLAAGLVWLALFTDRGFFSSALSAIGLINGPVTWLSYQSPVALFVAVIVAEVWRATAIVLVILVAGVQMIPKEFNEAAQVFGANSWQRFRHVTLPLLKPSLQTALILRTVMAFEVFAVVLALTGRDLPVLVGEAYQWQNSYQNNHVAAAYAVFILLISLAATLLYLKLLRVRKEQML